MSAIDWNGQARDILKAVRAVGYLEGMSATLWRLAGPEIANLLAAVGATQGEVDAAIRRMDFRNDWCGRF